MNSKILSTLLLPCFLSTSATAQQTRYGSNIIRLTPLSGFGQTFKKYDGHWSIGMSYEHILGRKQRIGICIPFYYGLNVQTEVVLSNGITINNYAYLWNPGVKFYPFGQTRLNYALGPSVFAAYGDASTYIGMGRTEIATYRKYGMMINNYLHFNCTPLFNICMELAIGISPINKRKVAFQQEQSLETTSFIKLGFQVGFRF
jgi:hypothetical protein